MELLANESTKRAERQTALSQHLVAVRLILFLEWSQFPALLDDFLKLLVFKKRSTTRKRFLRFSENQPDFLFSRFSQTWNRYAKANTCQTTWSFRWRQLSQFLRLTTIASWSDFTHQIWCRFFFIWDMCVTSPEFQVGISLEKLKPAQNRCQYLFILMTSASKNTRKNVSSAETQAINPLKGNVKIKLQSQGINARLEWDIGNNYFSGAQR